MASNNGQVPYFPPPPTSEYGAGYGNPRESNPSFNNQYHGEPRSAQDSRNRQAGWAYGSNPAPPPPAGGHAAGQSYDQPYYPQAPTPPNSGRRETHQKAYNPGEYVPAEGVAQYGSTPYMHAPNRYDQTPPSVASFDPSYDRRSLPRSSYNDSSQYREPDRKSRPGHQRAYSDDTIRDNHSYHGGPPKDRKQQHYRQTKLLAAVGGALAGGMGGRALGHDKYGTLAGAAAGAFGGPVLMEKLMDRKKNKGADEESLYNGDKAGHRSQRLLQDDGDYYDSRSDDEYDRRRRHKEMRSRDYRDDYDDYDDDYDRRGRSHRPDRGYSHYDDNRPSRGYSMSPTRSKTGYGLRARSKSIVDRFRTKISGGAVTDGEGKARDSRSTRDRGHSRTRRGSYDDDYTDSDEEYKRDSRRSWR